MHKKNNVLDAGFVYINQKQIDLNSQTDTRILSVKVVHSFIMAGWGKKRN